ncbi:MAG: FG-GAP repeat protein [Planctomycetota bacterium JB042]
MLTIPLTLALSSLAQTTFEETIHFHPPPVETVSFGRRIALGDANNDGELDLFASNPFHNGGRGAGWVLEGPGFGASSMFTVPGLIAEGGAVPEVTGSASGPGRSMT